MKLTSKQQRFVEEYLIDLNATQAAIRAGYSEKRASEIGWQQLQKTNVQKAIQKSKEERSKRTGITADRVLQELAHIAFDDIGNYMDFRTEKQLVGNDPETGKPVYRYAQVVEMKDSKDIDTKSIQEVSFSRKDGLKFKQYDKQKALVDLGKHLGLFTEKVEHSGTVVNKNIDLSYLSDEELDKVLKQHDDED